MYIRDEEVALWDRAVAFARARRLTMSALILSALEEFLARHGKDKD